MAKSKIDELNILSSSDEEEFEESFDYHDYIAHYFDTMQISEKQRKERIDAAEDIFDAILLLLIWCEDAPERVQEEDTQRMFENLYKEVIFQYGEPNDYFDVYVGLLIPLIISVTLEHISDPYYTSVERAANIACNESNSVINHTEYENAKIAGCKMKRWITEKDLRVRPTHAEVDEMVIPIDEPFLVGYSLLLFPKDQYTYNADPQEIVNCRCVCEYF